jgi:hypothetical protein
MDTGMHRLEYCRRRRFHTTVGTALALAGMPVAGCAVIFNNPAGSNSGAGPALHSVSNCNSSGSCPGLSSLSASAAAPSSSISVYGSNFSSSSTATINGVLCSSLTYVSSGTLTCTVPNLGNAPAQATVVVTNPGGDSVTATNAFVYMGSPILWLRADAGVNHTGSALNSWADQSGAGNNASVGHGAPTYVTTHSTATAMRGWHSSLATPWQALT